MICPAGKACAAQMSRERKLILDITHEELPWIAEVHSTWHDVSHTIDQSQEKIEAELGNIDVRGPVWLLIAHQLLEAGATREELFESLGELEEQSRTIERS